VLVHLPPPPQLATVAAVKALGDVKVIIATAAHDSYTKKWADLFPNAVVLAPDNNIPWLPVSAALRDMTSLLANYCITDVIETSSFSRSNDATFVLEIVGKRCVVMCCGVGNFNTYLNPISIHKYIGGFQGLRVFRQFAQLFCFDTAKFTKHIHEVARMQPQIVLFQHGTPLRKHIDALEHIEASRSPLSYPWPFALDHTQHTSYHPHQREASNHQPDVRH